MSSCGQDKFIANYFGEGYKGVALDVGACDGVFYSNTLLLEQQGWKVLCVEANPLYREALSVNRKEHVICAVSDINKVMVPFNIFDGGSGPTGMPYASHSSLTYTTPTQVISTLQLTLDTLVDAWDISRDSYGVPKIDLLCIDIEGGEFKALQGFNYKPQLICIEHTYKPDGANWLLNNGYKLLTQLGDDSICELL